MIGVPGTFKSISHSESQRVEGATVLAGASTPFSDQLEATNHLLTELVRAVQSVKLDVRVPAVGAPDVVVESPVNNITVDSADLADAVRQIKLQPITVQAPIIPTPVVNVSPTPVTFQQVLNVKAAIALGIPSALVVMVEFAIRFFH